MAALTPDDIKKLGLNQMGSTIGIKGPDGQVRSVQAYSDSKGGLYDPATGQRIKQTERRIGLGNQYATDYSLDDGTGSGGGSLADQMAIINAVQDGKKKEAERMAEQGYGPDGRPLDIKFNSMIDPKTGLLQSQYQLQARPDVTADQRAVDAIRARGLAKGPSDWANAATEKQRLEESGLLDTTRQQQSGAQAQTLANLMMRGGLSSGSRERMAGRSARDMMMAAQGVARGGMLDRANIGLQDEQFKTQALKDTAGFDFQNAGIANSNRAYQTDVQGKNLSAALNELQRQRDFEMDKYKSKMQEWGAGKTADAQRAASGGGKK